MKKKLLFLVVCIFFVSTNAIGQITGSANSAQVSGGISQVPGSTLKVVRNVSIREDSKAENILINIDKATNQFSLSIESIIEEGSLTIEIYDSFGKKQGNFTIATQLGAEKTEMVNGQFQKSWKNLPTGKWEVKILPSSATAEIRIVTALID